MTPLSENTLRQELDAAIKKRNALGAEFFGIQAAQEKIASCISELRKNLRSAEAAFEEAKQESVSNLVHEAMGEAQTDQPSMRQLRANMASVEDELEAALEAQKELADRRRQIDSRLGLATMATRRAFDDVIKNSPEVNHLIEEAKALEEQIIERISQITYLVGCGHLPHGIYETLALQPANLGKGLATTPQTAWAILSEKAGKSIPSAWKAAVAGLDKDASFPLPGDDVSTPKKGPLRKLMGGA
ncbi:hypothetical protein JK182_07510 [Acetobacter okinawensis]|uniref:hypothetical protein n=1 Tax=Acetobacter okinawensis TaxID=1076594 RepID=UPI001BAA6D0F|nr:hypothetical protein [Acetobacter okinawensis]MBS0988513.1 hypothetical protein [Acetobacter okinawensis]